MINKDKYILDFENWVYNYVSKFKYPVKSIMINSEVYKNIQLWPNSGTNEIIFICEYGTIIIKEKVD